MSRFESRPAPLLSLAQDSAGITVLACIVAYLLALGLRLLEAPLWGEPFRVLGVPLLSSNDGYFWLAGAKDLGRGAGSPMALLAQLLAGLGGGSLQAVGFWTPPFVASLVAPLLVLWGRSLLGREGVWVGAAAGVLAAWAPAFVARSRLGFYDTDMVILFWPLLAGGLLASWLGALLCGEKPPWVRLLLAGVAAGLAAPWHRLLPLALVAMALAAAGCAVLEAPKGRKREGMLGALSVAAFAALGVWGGLAAGLGLIALWLWRRFAWPPLSRKVLAIMAGLTLVAVMLLSGGELLLEAHSWLQRTGSRLVVPAAPEGPVFPPMAQAIEEAAPLDVQGFLLGLHPWAGAGALGVLGFLYLLRRRPEAWVLAPLLLLGVLSLHFGGRTVLFTAPAVFLGLCSAPVLAAGAAPRKGAAASVLLALVLALPLGRAALQMRPQPALQPEEARALMRLRELTPPGARLWIWWDQGHAARFFAEREPLADGGKQGGEYVYLLGRTLGTRSPEQAAAVMRFTAAAGYAPWHVWAGMDGTELETFMQSLKAETLPEGAAPQYLVCSPAALHSLQQLLRAGAWRVDGTSPAPPQVYDASGLLALDLEQGAAVLGNGAQLPLERILEKQPGRTITARYTPADGGEGYCLARAPLAGVEVLADAAACDTLAVRWLLEGHVRGSGAVGFQQVLDAAPWLAVYELKGSGS